MQIEVGSNDSELSGHRLQFLLVDHGQRHGYEAWVGVFADRTAHRRTCLWIWTADEGVLSATLTYDVGDCPRRLRRAKPEI